MTEKPTLEEHMRVATKSIEEVTKLISTVAWGLHAQDDPSAMRCISALITRVPLGEIGFHNKTVFGKGIRSPGSSVDVNFQFSYPDGRKASKLPPRDFDFAVKHTNPVAPLITEWDLSLSMRDENLHIRTSFIDPYLSDRSELVYGVLADVVPYNQIAVERMKLVPKQDLPVLRLFAQRLRKDRVARELAISLEEVTATAERLMQIFRTDSVKGVLTAFIEGKVGEYSE